MEECRLGIDDEKDWAKWTNTLVSMEKLTSELSGSGNKREIGEVEYSNRKVAYDTNEAKQVDSFLKHIKENYDFDFAKPIDPVGSYSPAILPGESELTYGPAALFAYSKLLLFRDHYVDTPQKDKKDTLEFFSHYLQKFEKHIKGEKTEKGWDVWYDWFWLLVKVVSSRDWDFKKYTSLHNKYWQLRMRNQCKDYKSGLAIYSKELPDGFNDELEEIISSAFRVSSKIYGRDPLQFKCFLDALNIANDNEPCLIIGETGTGKEGIARLIHAASYRGKNRFQPINCAGITDSLFNSEISGIVKGAATDVSPSLGGVLAASGYEKTEIGQGKGKSKIEKIQTPENISETAGTLFLDEINSLSMQHQAKLLRIIQEKEVMMVGSQTLKKVELKFVCAVNQDILKEVRDGNFREDLYYRVSKGKIRVPTLREMPDTIVEIAEGFLEKLANERPRYSANGYIRKPPGITRKAKSLLKSYDWPGNVRELENVTYRAYIQLVQEDKRVIASHHIDLTKVEEQVVADDSLSDLFSMEYTEAKNEFDKVYVEAALRRANGNKSEVSRETGIDRAQLNRKIKVNNIDVVSFKRS